MKYEVYDDIVADQSDLPPDYWEKVLEWYERIKPVLGDMSEIIYGGSVKCDK